MIRYQEYHLNNRERLIGIVQGTGLCGSILYLFYHSIIVTAIAVIPSVYLFLRMKKKKRIAERKWELTVQFKDAIEALVAALSAGYSMEHALSEAKRDLQYLYAEDTCIMQELTEAEQKVKLRVSVQDVFKNLGERSEVEEIQNFAEIYETARKSGGKMLEIMKRTSRSISTKIEMKREIQTLITGKQLEMKCMTLIPLAIILYLGVSSPGFLGPLYHGVFGRSFMTIALFFYVGSYFLASKIMNIV